MSTKGWYPAAIDNWALSTGGSHLGPVTIGVLHTTESPRGSFKPQKGNYFGHQNYPHFTCDVQGGIFKVWQHISITLAARAMANDAGGVQTNREGVIQIEVVGRASEPFTEDPIMVAGLKKLMRWIESETDIPRSSTVVFWAGKYGENVPHRMSYSAWVKYEGWCGHQHVPENEHYDPGAINIKSLLLSDSLKIEVTPHPHISPEVITPEEELMYKVVADPAGSGDHGTNGVTKFRFASQEAKNEWVGMFNATRATMTQALFDSIPTVEGPA